MPSSNWVRSSVSPVRERRLQLEMNPITALYTATVTVQTITITLHYNYGTDEINAAWRHVCHPQDKNMVLTCGSIGINPLYIFQLYRW